MEKSENKISIFNIVIIILFIFVVTVAAKAVICKAKGTINYIFGKYALMYVISGSMEPIIPTNSYILIKKTDVSKIKTDAVISFISDDPQIKGSINTHRVVEILENGEFVTKGDSVPTQDPTTAKPEKVVGEYVGNAKFLTVAGNAFASKSGGIVVFGVLGITVIIAIVRVALAAYMTKYETEKETKEEEKHNVTEA